MFFFLLIITVFIMLVHRVVGEGGKVTVAVLVS